MRGPEQGAEDSGREGGKGLRGQGEGEQRHGEEAPGVARVIALKLPPCKNTPSKRVPTRRGCLVSSRLGFFVRDKTLHDVSGRRDSRWPEIPLLIRESGIVIF